MPLASPLMAEVVEPVSHLSWWRDQRREPQVSDSGVPPPSASCCLIAVTVPGMLHQGTGQWPWGVLAEPDYGGSYVCPLKSFNFILKATESHWEILNRGIAWSGLFLEIITLAAVRRMGGTWPRLEAQRAAPERGSDPARRAGGWLRRGNSGAEVGTGSRDTEQAESAGHLGVDWMRLRDGGWVQVFRWRLDFFFNQKFTKIYFVKVHG